MQPLARIVEQIEPGARYLAHRALTGGVSAAVYALDYLSREGERRTVVVREHGTTHHRDAGAEATERDYALLQSLHDFGLAVPRPLLLDTSCNVLARPFLVMQFMPGSMATEELPLAEVIMQMAGMLAQIHSLPTSAMPKLPARLDPLPELLEFLPDHSDWRELGAWLASLTDTAYREAPGVLHGDFWPGNLLWQNGTISAVLDWEDAALGDPMSDVACCRLELMHAHGDAAFDKFTDAYRSHRQIDPYRLDLWQLYVGLAAAKYMSSWGLAPEREANMRSNALTTSLQAASRLMNA